MTRAEERREWTRQKQGARANREREWGKRIAAMNAWRIDPLYGVIQTDDLTLPTLPAAKDAVLFLWSPQTPGCPEALYYDGPRLPEAFAAVKNWGFTYKTSFYWCEVTERRPVRTILTCTRGRIPAPAPGQQPKQSFFSAVDGPDGHAVISDMIRAMFPSTPCLSVWSGVAADVRLAAG